MVMVGHELTVPWRKADSMKERGVLSFFLTNMLQIYSLANGGYMFFWFLSSFSTKLPAWYSWASVQHDPQQIALKSLSGMPFERASELFCKAAGSSSYDHQMHARFVSFADIMGLQ
jgi:hypothetical protein